MSATRGAERARHFTDLDRVIQAIRDARELGARGLMLSTHERSIEICNRLRAEPTLSEGLAIYPLLPYAQKYITRANAVGMVNMVQEALGGMPTGRKLATLWNSGRALLSKDVSAILRSLVQVELNAFRGLNVKAVFLHDTLTDLAISLELREALAGC